MPGELYRAADRFRAAQDRRDAAIWRQLTLEYRNVVNEIQAAYDALYQQVRRDIEQGNTFTIDRFQRLTRYRRLMAQIVRRLEDYGVFAGGVISSAQREAVEIAARESAALWRAALTQDLLEVPEIVGRGALGQLSPSALATFQRVPVEALDFLVGTLGDGTPLRNYFLRGTPQVPALSSSVIDQVARNLAQGLASGWNPLRTARLFRDAMGVGLTRSLRIARTEILRSYREATRANYAANGIVEYEWIATLDTRTCMACIALDGTRYAMDTPMRNHVNCRCTMVPVMPFAIPRIRRSMDGEFEGTGADWFEQLDSASQMAMMGPGKYQAWRAGAISLRDMVGEHETQTFGISYVEASLKAMLGEAAGDYYQ